MANLISNLGFRLYQASASTFYLPAAVINLQCVRNAHKKHFDPKFKKLRREKVIKIDIPDFQEDPGSFTEEQMRAKLKEHGLLPPRPWNEVPYFISSTGSIFEPYIPPEGDGKISPIHVQGAKQKIEFLEKKSKTMFAIRKIRSYEDDFDTEQFCKDAEKIYIKMHECIGNNDIEELKNYVTERAIPEVIHNIENKTIRWKFIKNIELPNIVQARCTDIITKENMFAQITVRFHTQQSLAVYDRFGRLMYGSEIIAKDVLEYVIFEKHISNLYGVWRIHAKIIPDWVPPKEPSRMTYVQPEEVKKVEETAVVETSKQ